MNRITEKVLTDLWDRINTFWPAFKLGMRYGYYCPEYNYPPGTSGVRNFDTGLKAREAYYWMQGFLSCYYKIKEGVITPPKIAPAGKSLWVVHHEEDEIGGCINFVYVPEDMSWDEVVAVLRPKDWKPSDDDFAIEVEFDRIWHLNSPVDTQGEQDGI